MNKKVIILVAFFGSLVLGSCTKDWDCECTIGSGDTTIVTHETIEATKFDKAREKCEDKDATTYGSCKLKA